MNHQLVHIVTRYDRMQSKKLHYNHYALAQYLARVDEVISRVNAGEEIKAVVSDCFNDRLRDYILKSL